MFSSVLKPILLTYGRNALFANVINYPPYFNVRAGEAIANLNAQDFRCHVLPVIVIVQNSLYGWIQKGILPYFSLFNIFI